ncbi:MAG: SAM-dependent methyltransferase [Bacteroidales bacterium]
MKGILYLIPLPLGDNQLTESIPSGVIEITGRLRHFIVEEIRTARRYLRKTDREFPLDESVFHILNEHTRKEELAPMLDSALRGNDIGLMSEAGLPGIADPGALIVGMAHRKGITVKPLTGPSSILLALISSGLNGQNFCFHGYLPVKPSEREKKIREIETRSKTGEAQIFMETPYRNMKMVNDLLRICMKSTRLCIASAITTDAESIVTLTIAEWKSRVPEINKIPAVFVLQA